MSLRGLTAALVALVLSGCASSLEYSRIDPLTGATEHRNYKIGYGNEVTDSVVGFTLRPSDNVTAAGERIMTYGLAQGGVALQQQLISSAINLTH
jgi:hypothetical protein